MAAPKGNGYAIKGWRPATSQLQLRVIPAEKAKWKKMAERSGIPLSEWVLDAIRDKAERG